MHRPHAQARVSTNVLQSTTACKRSASHRPAAAASLPTEKASPMLLRAPAPSLQPTHPRTWAAAETAPVPTSWAELWRPCAAAVLLGGALRVLRWRQSQACLLTPSSLCGGEVRGRRSCLWCLLSGSSRETSRHGGRPANYAAQGAAPLMCPDARLHGVDARVGAPPLAAAARGLVPSLQPPHACHHTATFSTSGAVYICSRTHWGRGSPASI